MKLSKYASTDPMALVLSDEAYLIWTEIHHPHEPAISKIPAVIKTLTAAEKKFALARAKTLVAYGKAIEEHCK